jgi:hypothetical protein
VTVLTVLQRNVRINGARRRVSGDVSEVWQNVAETEENCILERILKYNFTRKRNAERPKNSLQSKSGDNGTSALMSREKELLKYRLDKY